MQNLMHNLIDEVKKERMKKMDKEIREQLNSFSNEMVICPFCKYISRNNHPSAKVFDVNGKRTFKCWHCSTWRRL